MGKLSTETNLILSSFIIWCIWVYTIKVVSQGAGEDAFFYTVLYSTWKICAKLLIRELR